MNLGAYRTPSPPPPPQAWRVTRWQKFVVRSQRVMPQVTYWQLGLLAAVTVVMAVGTLLWGSSALMATATAAATLVVAEWTGRILRRPKARRSKRLVQ
jgi:hypothetical protein